MAMLQEKVWCDKPAYDKAERLYYEKMYKMNNLVTTAEVCENDLSSRLLRLGKENQELKTTVQELQNLVKKLEIRVDTLENRTTAVVTKSQGSDTNKDLNQARINKSANGNEDDLDLFGSDSEEEDEEAKKIKEQRVAAYAAKKSKKPVLIAKSNIILDVKPWDDETDMSVMEKEVRNIQMDGLLWGAAKLVPLAYGIKKLQISCVVEDDKVSVDELTEKITDIEDYVQSVDIAAFNKV